MSRGTRALLVLLLSLALCAILSQNSAFALAAAEDDTDLSWKLPQCSGCEHRAVTEGCPDPAACGYLPVRCVFCLDGVSMPNCPRPDWCGYKPAQPSATRVLGGDDDDDAPNNGRNEPSAAEPSLAEIAWLLASGDETGLGVASVQGLLHGHGHDDCAMVMNFNTMEAGFCVLFKSWKVTSAGGMVLAVLFVLALGFCRESLDVWSYRLSHRRRLEVLQTQAEEAEREQERRRGSLNSDQLLAAGRHASDAEQLVSLRFQVEGMTCDNCERTLSRGIGAAPRDQLRVSFADWNRGELWVEAPADRISEALQRVPALVRELGYLTAAVDAQGSAALLRLHVSEGLDSEPRKQELERAVLEASGRRPQTSVPLAETWVPVGGAGAKETSVLLPELERALDASGFRIELIPATPESPAEVAEEPWSFGLAFLVSLSHAVLLLLAYVLMLIVMTYNVYLCLAMVAGCALGHFVSRRFLWRAQAEAQPVTESDHCCQK